MKLHKFVYTAICGLVLAGASTPTLSTFAASNANQVSVTTEASDLSNDNFDFTQFNRNFDFASNAALPEIKGVDYSKFTDVEIDWDNFSYADLTPMQLELFQLVTRREYLRQTISGEISPDVKSLSDFTGEMALFFEGNMYLHGLISDSVAAAAINIVIDAVLAAVGYGSLKAIYRYG